LPHVFERAPTGRAKCRACSQPIAAGDWRFGERLPNPYADGDNVEMTHWYHLPCAAFKRPEAYVAALDNPGAPPPQFEGRAALDHEARLALKHHRLARADAAGRSPSSRASCRACKEKIERGAWRIGLVWYEEGRFVPAGYIHLACARSYFETAELMVRLRHCSEGLTDVEFAEIENGLAKGGG